MVSVESHHSVQRSVQIGEDGVQCLNLGCVARIAVEDPTVLGIIHGQTILDDLVGQLVRNQFALVDVLQCLNTELGLVLDVVAEDIAGGDCRNTVVLAQQRSLGALTDALRSHNQQSHVILRFIEPLARLSDSRLVT